MLLGTEICGQKRIEYETVPKVFYFCSLTNDDLILHVKSRIHFTIQPPRDTRFMRAGVRDTATALAAVIARLDPK